MVPVVAGSIPVVRPSPSLGRATRQAAAVLAILLLSAVAARAADPVIGAVYPAGIARQAIDVALDIVNGTHAPVPVLMGGGGGLDRLNGARLAVAYADDGGDPAQAAAAAEHLVTDEHASVLVGGLSDAAAAAISRVAEAHGLPFLALNSALPNEAGLAWFFRLGRTPARDAASVLQQLGAIAGAHGRPFQTVALLFDDDPDGRAAAAPLRAAAAAAALEVADMPVPPGTAVSDATLRAIAAAKPDAVLLLRAEPDDPARLAGSGPLVLLRSVRAATVPDGAFRPASFTLDPLPTRPGVSVVDSAFKARTGRSLDADSAREITGLLLLADVVNRAGSTKPLDLRTALMATDTPGGETLMLWQGIRFDDSGQNVRATPALEQAQGGTFRTVRPDDVATASATWPTPP